RGGGRATTARGVKTARGGPWNAAQVSDVINRPFAVAALGGSECATSGFMIHHPILVEACRPTALLLDRSKGGPALLLRRQECQAGLMRPRPRERPPQPPGTGAPCLLLSLQRPTLSSNCPRHDRDSADAAETFPHNAASSRRSAWPTSGRRPLCAPCRPCDGRA